MTFLNQPPGCKVSCQRDTEHFYKIINSVLSKVTLCLKVKEKHKNDLNDETLIFTLIVIIT